MGKFSEMVKAAAEDRPKELPEVWDSHFPLLKEAMFPLPGKASGTFATPRFSVTVFTDCGELKAVVGAKDGPRKFWITLDGPEAILEMVELALQKGQGQWREAKE
jgi:hypothetical protein